MHVMDCNFPRKHLTPERVLKRPVVVANEDPVSGKFVPGIFLRTFPVGIIGGHLTLEVGSAQLLDQSGNYGQLKIFMPIFVD